MERSDVRMAEQWLERERELEGPAIKLANLMNAVKYLTIIVKEQAAIVSRLEAAVEGQTETISRLESRTHGTANIALRTLTLADNGRPNQSKRSTNFSRRTSL